MLEYSTHLTSLDKVLSACDGVHWPCFQGNLSVGLGHTLFPSFAAAFFDGGEYILNLMEKHRYEHPRCRTSLL